MLALYLWQIPSYQVSGTQKTRLTRYSQSTFEFGKSGLRAWSEVVLVWHETFLLPAVSGAQQQRSDSGQLTENASLHRFSEELMPHTCGQQVIMQA